MAIIVNCNESNALKQSVINNCLCIERRQPMTIIVDCNESNALERSVINYCLYIESRQPKQRLVMVGYELLSIYRKHINY